MMIMDFSADILGLSQTAYVDFIFYCIAHSETINNSKIKVAKINCLPFELELDTVLKNSPYSMLFQKIGENIAETSRVNNLDQNTKGTYTLAKATYTLKIENDVVYLQEVMQEVDTEKYFISSFEFPVTAPPLETGLVYLESLQGNDLYFELKYYLPGLRDQDLIKVHESFLQEDSLKAVRFLMGVEYSTDEKQQQAGIQLDLYVEAMHTQEFKETHYLC